MYSWGVKKRFVIGNWKMYIASPSEAKKFALTLTRRARLFRGLEVWVAPPFTLLSLLQPTLKNTSVRLGAQTVSAHKAGAHTGDVSATMLKQTGASFVLVGHSDRRALGETDALIHEELLQTIQAGLTAVLCIGEREHDHNGSYFEVISSQLSSALSDFPRSATRKLMIAYEPVWAIGKTAQDAMNPGELQEMQIFIRKILVDILGRESARGVPVLYGGSIEPQNAHLLMQEGGVSGFLVGHASAEIESFIEILSACKK